jgi:VanZ family protein
LKNSYKIQSGEVYTRIATRIIAWFFVTVIVVLSLIPPNWRPLTGAPHHVEHATVFSITGFAFGLGYKQNYRFFAVLLVAFSAVLEIAQFFVPGRHARLADFITDALAACIGLLVGAHL